MSRKMVIARDSTAPNRADPDTRSVRTAVTNRLTEQIPKTGGVQPHCQRDHPCDRSGQQHEQAEIVEAGRFEGSKGPGHVSDRGHLPGGRRPSAKSRRSYKKKDDGQGESAASMRLSCG